MKKTVLFMFCTVCLMILASNYAHADIVTLSPGTEEVHLSTDELVEGFLYGNEPIAGVFMPGGGGGGGGAIGYYDLSVSMEKYYYTVPTEEEMLNQALLILQQRGVLAAKITIDYAVNSTPPERDGVLVYGIAYNNGTRITESLRTVKEGDNNIWVQVIIPSTLQPGIYTFYAEWNILGLEKVTAKDQFEIVKELNVWEQLVNAYGQMIASLSNWLNISIEVARILFWVSLFFLILFFKRDKKKSKYKHA